MTSSVRPLARTQARAFLPAAPSSFAVRAQALPFALALLAMAIQGQAQAQGPGPNKLDSVVVTATRSPIRLSEVLTDLTVLTRADIERQAFGGLADLLRNSGCVEMVRNGGPGTTTSLFLRGADTRHTVVLVDGVRVDSQASGGAAWQGIPLSQIERVEVLKGPASAIYGSDAVGGVVQIFTRKGGPRLQAELGAGLGNLGTRKLDAGLTGSSGLLDFALSAAAERSDGFNSTIDSPSSFSYIADRDGWKNHNLKGRIGLQLNAAHRLEALALSNHSDAQYDGSKSSPDNDDHSIQDTRVAQLSWSAQWLPALQTQLSLAQSTEKYETKPSVYLTETQLRNISLNGSYQIAKGQQLNFILERREDRLENPNLLSDNKIDKRRQHGLALGWLWNQDALSLQVHGRHDDDSQFGGVNTGTVAAGYVLTSGLRLVSSVGTAFRAPTLFQRASEYSPDLSKPGIKPLDPERGRNLEFGLKYNTEHSEFSLTAYRNRIRDLIIYGAPGSCVNKRGCYQNVASARLQGLSLQGSTEIAGIRLSSTLDLQAPKNMSNGKLLARRARVYGTLRADTTVANWKLGAAVQSSGQRYDDAANSKPLAGYALLNLDAQYSLTRELRLQLNLDNAFNRSYQTAGGYAQAPRTVFVSLRYSPASL
ncbi:TonB-dependent receptor plug domain-containing protein [Kinneretia aquatilis]|uniref:TonB-dependent receptor plug domain-containing protein n=1 Tax=Kinneretia aquatilis TaxID=2070761 RepID=UPI001495312D|nr:TonB-dependent receptor [Paucibacter aquatile]WIV97017.1 TonB-dependent receptor [Paucibacter aquatile]